MKKKRIIRLITMVLLVLSVPLMMGATEFSDSLKIKTEFQKENPYVQAYIKERGIVANENDLLNNSEQRAIDIERLNKFYAEDIEVAGILQKYQPATRSVNMVAKTTSLNKENISQILDTIVTIYDSATEEEQSLMLSFMMRYVRKCGSERSTAFFESLNNSEAVPLATYNPLAARDYAYQWYNSFNTASYPNLEANWGDCTNFVSQCLKAGGYTFRDNWYVYKKNNVYPRPENSTQLDYSWTLAQPKSPWISLDEFCGYWYPRVRKYQWSKQTYQTRHDEIYSMDIGIGDVVILCSGVSGVMTFGKHAMIITAYDSAGKDFKLSGHTNPRKDYALLTILSTSGYNAVDFYLF